MGLYMAAFGILVYVGVLVLVGIDWFLLLAINSTEKSKAHLFHFITIVQHRPFTC